jgi:adenylate cyclase
MHGASVKRTPKRLWPAWLVSLLIVSLVLAIVASLRREGYLQRLEFFAYDFFIKRQVPAMATDPRIVLVGINEDDIHMPGLAYPIPDETMAQLMKTIEAQGPRAIGLDIYRDIPLPDQAHRELFDQVLLSNSNIICIFRFPDALHPGVKPPASLAGMPDRIAFNDLLIDPDGIMRRTLLYQDDGTNIFYSLDSRLALLYLEPEGIQLEPDVTNPDRLRLGKGSLRPLDSRDGPYVKLDTAGYQFLMDFKGPRMFQTVSWSQLVGEKLPQDTFSNKVVIVGMTAQSVQDDKVTALEQRHRGIDVHAQIVNQLLRTALNGEPQRAFWKEWQKDTWVLLWCLAGGAVGYAIRSPWRSYTLLSVTLFILGGVAWRAFNSGWWIPLAAPALACVAAAVSVNWYISSQEKAQRAMIMHLFAKQVSREVAETIWDQRNDFLEGGRPRSQKLMATVLYTDLKGYSTLSETLEPAALMDWLNEYMSMMAQVVSAHHGVIDKFIGDAVMAMFGVPLARKTEEEIKQDGVNAVRCALAMEAALEKLNALWTQRHLPVCSMRVGIHTGSLVAGSLGSADRMEYTVIGDTVNTASRLESFDKDYDEPELAGRRCRILVGESTWALLGDRFEGRCVGNMTLKGKSQEITIYRIVKELS